MSRSATLGEFVSITRGTTYKSALLGQSGPVLLGLASIARNGGFRSDSLRTYGGDSPEKLLVRPGQLFASLKDVTQVADLLGSVARVPKDGPVGRLTQDTVRLDITSSEIDQDYLYWMLLTPQYRSYCRSHATGTTNLGLPREDFLGYEFLLPGLLEQRRIAAVLSSLDDLIEHNRGQSGVMNDLWRTLVLSHADGTDEVKLSDLARFVNGRNFTKEASGVGMPVIRTPEVRNGPSANSVRNDVSASDDHVARLGDILFVWSGSLLVDRWAYGPGLVNQHIFKVLPNDGVPPWLGLWAIEQLMVDFLGVAADKATTMGHIKREDLNRTVNVPRREQWSELDAKIKPLYDLSMGLQAEINDLSRTRDELLPLLMSGRVRVKARTT